MAVAVWKGPLRFGLVALAVKLYRAAKAEKISFRQLQKATGVRVRHTVSAGVVHLDAAITSTGTPAEKSVDNSGLTAPSPMLAANAHADSQWAALKHGDLV